MTIGFDLGGQNCKAAVTRPAVGRGGGNMIDIVLDNASKRSVPPYVVFPEKERQFGLNAKKGFKGQIRTTIAEPHRFNGLAYSELSEEKVNFVEIAAHPVPTDGGVQTPVFKLNYQDEEILITPEHATALLLKHQVEFVEKLGVTSKECCIAVPNNCSYARRQALLAAAEIAGVDCLKLITNTACLALDYGLLGRAAKLKMESAVIFVDVGHTGVNMGCVRFFQGGWDIVRLDTFEGFSGAMMEQKMIELFDQKFAQANGERFSSSAKSVIKVREILPKMLKTLVVDETARMNIDYLYQDFDFKLEISRDEIREIMKEEFIALDKFVKDFFTESKKTVSELKLEKPCEITTVEIVGQVSRMLDVREMLTNAVKETLGIEKLMTTCNTDESVVKGCVLQTAILSPRFGIRGGQIKDVVPYSIVVGRENGVEFDVANWSDCNFDTLFPSLNEINKTKTIKFKKPRSLTLILCEEDMREKKKLIGYASLDTSHAKLGDGEEWSKFQILVTLDHSGQLQLRAEITVSSTEMVDVPKQKEVAMSEEEYAAALQKAQEEAKKKAEEAAKKKAEEKDAAASDNAEAGDADVQMEEVEVPEVKVSKMKTITVTEQQEKKVFKKIDVPVKYTSYMKMSSDVMAAIKTQESKMSTFDAECLKVQAARNDLETYVLSAQEEFAEGGTYFEYMNQDEADNFMNSILEMDEWLMDDEFDQTAQVYGSKLDSLRTVGNVYQVRCDELSARETEMLKMRKSLNSIQAWLAEGCKAEQYAHIDEPTIAELTQKVVEASKWLDERQALGAASPKNVDPPFYAVEVSTKNKEIIAAYQAVKNIPKPEPKKEEEEVASKEEAEKPEPAEDVKMEDTENKDAGGQPDVEMENTSTEV